MAWRSKGVGSCVLMVALAAGTGCGGTETSSGAPAGSSATASGTTGTTATGMTAAGGADTTALQGAGGATTATTGTVNATGQTGGATTAGQAGSTVAVNGGGSATTTTGAGGAMLAAGGSGGAAILSGGGAMSAAGGATAMGGAMATGGMATGGSGQGGTMGIAGAGAGGMPSATTALINDDFESVSAGGPPDPAVWQLRVPGGNSIEVSTEQAHSGSRAVKVMGSSGSTMLLTEQPFPLPAGVIYFRVWMRFADADWSGHNAFIESSPGQESQEVRFGGQNGAYHSNLAADGDGLSPDPFEYPECSRCVAPVADQWACLRGKFDFANNAAELYVGDALAVDSATDGWHSGNGTFPENPTEIGFGWALYGAVANTVYYDDVAIGYEPIACE